MYPLALHGAGRPGGPPSLRPASALCKLRGGLRVPPAAPFTGQRAVNRGQRRSNRAPSFENVVLHSLVSSCLTCPFRAPSTHLRDLECRLQLPRRGNHECMTLVDSRATCSSDHPPSLLRCVHRSPARALPWACIRRPGAACICTFSNSTRRSPFGPGARGEWAPDPRDWAAPAAPRRAGGLAADPLAPGAPGSYSGGGACSGGLRCL